MSTLIGQRIRELRVRAGLTQTELAKGIVTPSMISQIEAGKAQPSQALLRKLAERLNAPDDTLVSSNADEEAIGAFFQIARALLRWGEHETVRERLEAHAELHEYAEWHLLYATAALLQNDWEHAYKSFSKALIAAQDQGKTQYYPQIYLSQGDILLALDDAQTALHLYEQALLFLRTGVAHDEPQEAEVLMRMSRAWDRAGDHAQALQWAEDARARVTVGYESKEHALRQLHLADQRSREGDHAEAERIASQVQSLQRVVQWLETDFEAELVHVEALVQSGNGQEAQARLERSLRLQELVGNANLTARILMKDSLITGASGEPLQAIQKAMRAIETESGPHADLIRGALAASSLAETHALRKEAITLAEYAYRQSESIHHDALLVTCTTHLARLHEISGDADKAAAVRARLPYA